ncbi:MULTISPECIES: hypothetical protein [Pseudofrankia]|uniref:hypothetical protein n=1 Tax=Pseudofrankia TaxID=2994363 RepID=UPI000234CD92|nr:MULTISPECIES: hypothetical protein [Pseudofrankia]
MYELATIADVTPAAARHHCRTDLGTYGQIGHRALLNQLAANLTWSSWLHTRQVF